MRQAYNSATMSPSVRLSASCHTCSCQHCTNIACYIDIKQHTSVIYVSRINETNYTIQKHCTLNYIPQLFFSVPYKCKHHTYIYCILYKYYTMQTLQHIYISKILPIQALHIPFVHFCDIQGLHNVFCCMYFVFYMMWKFSDALPCKS